MFSVFNDCLMLQFVMLQPYVSNITFRKNLKEKYLKKKFFGEFLDTFGKSGVIFGEIRVIFYEFG